MKHSKLSYSIKELDELRGILKTVLRGYSSVNRELLCSLQALGFEASRKRNHYILTTHSSYYSGKNEDKMLVFVLSGTQGNSRAGLNLVSIICNTIREYI